MGEEESITNKKPKMSWVVLGILVILGIIILAYAIVIATEGEDPSRFKERLLSEVQEEVSQAQRDIEQASQILESSEPETT